MTGALHRKIFADYWYRFDRYEIKGGYIRPSPGAKLSQYKPWDAFGPRKGQAGRSQPYQSLLQLAQEIDFDLANGTVRLAGNGEDRILEWCAQYGLLGLLLHRVEGVVRLNLECLPSAAYPMMKATKFTRTSRGWQETIHFPASLGTRPGVYLRKDIQDHELTFEPLGETWARFFPDVPDNAINTYDYPTPFSPEFWQQYAEPVAGFSIAARGFRDAVDIARTIGSQRRVSEEDQPRVLQAEDLINALAAPARPLLYAAAKGYGFGYACHSLLAAYAMMVELDLSSARLLECANAKCRSLFVTKAAAGKYCSRTCRGNVQMRKYRRKRARKSPSGNK